MHIRTAYRTAQLYNIYTRDMIKMLHCGEPVARLALQGLHAKLHSLLFYVPEGRLAKLQLNALLCCVGANN